MFAARGGFFTPARGSPSPNSPFLMVVDTLLTPGDLTFNMPLLNYAPFTGTIDWGDGIVQNITEADSQGYPNYLPHVYASDGIYTISMTGTMFQMGGNTPQTSKDKIVSIVDWGTLNWIYLDNFCSMYTNLINVPDYLPATVINTYNMFSGTINFNDFSVVNWDMSKVTDTSFMFAGSGFNQNISGWDVSAVTDMTRMFGSYDLGRESQFNQDISSWNVTGVIMKMYGTGFDTMFYNNKVFNQDLSSWCVSAITSIPTQFSTGATSWTLPKPNWGAPC